MLHSFEANKKVYIYLNNPIHFPSSEYINNIITKSATSVDSIPLYNLNLQYIIRFNKKLLSSKPNKCLHLSLHNETI